MVRRRHKLVPLTVAAVIIGGVSPAAAQLSSTPGIASTVNAIDALTCVVPSDTVTFEGILSTAASPMAGSADVIVSSATAVDIDPRFIMAIAAHETMLGTYGPAREIHNPFGLGPGMVFDTEADAIRFAVGTLARNYFGDGLQTISQIGARWAPVGAANDPGGLNQHWTAGVSAAYTTLGGNAALPPLLSVQRQGGECVGNPSAGLLSPVAPEPPAEGVGPPLVVIWGGNAPTIKPFGDQAAARSATLPGFAFPLAVRIDGESRYAQTACGPGSACTVTLEAAPGIHAIAASDGRLVAATAQQRTDLGVAFWIVRPDGNKLGYGPLASYAPGISHGAYVRLGAPLGTTTGQLTFAWRRAGAAIDPYPLLVATRPPSSKVPAS
ncbi:MAG: hypothetical protein R2878_10170 [Thermoleophilia bacterium]